MLYPAGSGTRAMPSPQAPVLDHPLRSSSLRIVRSARFARRGRTISGQQRAFVAQRISVAVQLSMAQEAAEALGLSVAADPRAR